MATLHPTTHLQAAGPVPGDNPERPWGEAADLAAHWIWERSKVEGVKPLLVTNTLRNGRGIESLEEVARTGGQATAQGKARFERCPVLACVPGERTLKLALNLARGHSRVILETASFPLGEWAHVACAINLLDDSPSGLSDESRWISSAQCSSAATGGTANMRREHARDHLLRHVRASRLAPDQAASCVMTKGVTDKGAKRLRLLWRRAD